MKGRFYLLLMAMLAVQYVYGQHPPERIELLQGFSYSLLGSAGDNRSNCGLTDYRIPYSGCPRTVYSLITQGCTFNVYRFRRNDVNFEPPALNLTARASVTVPTGTATEIKYFYQSRQAQVRYAWTICDMFNVFFYPDNSSWQDIQNGSIAPISVTVIVNKPIRALSSFELCREEITNLYSYFENIPETGNPTFQIVSESGTVIGNVVGNPAEWKPGNNNLTAGVNYRLRIGYAYANRTSFTVETPFTVKSGATASIPTVNVCKDASNIQLTSIPGSVLPSGTSITNSYLFANLAGSEIIDDGDSGGPINGATINPSELQNGINYVGFDFTASVSSCNSRVVFIVNASNWYESSPDGKPFLTTPETICEGQALNLRSFTGGGPSDGVYEFTSSNASVPIQGGNSINVSNISSNLSTNITAKVTKDGCSKTSDAKTITVTDIGTTPSISGKTNVCIGEIVTYTASGGKGNFQWIDGNNLSIGTGPNLVLAVSNNMTIRAYSEVNGCQGPSATINVTASQGSTMPTASGNEYCAASPANLQLSATGNGVIRWYSSALGSNVLATSANYTVSTPLNTTTSFYVSSQETGKCESARREVVINIKPLTPTPTTPDQSFCGSQTTVNLTVQGSGTGATYTFYNVANGGTPVFGPTTTNVVLTNVTANRTYYVEALAPNMCTSTRKKVDVIISSIGQDPVPNHVRVCGPQSVNVSVSGGNQFIWYTAPTGSTTISGQTDADYVTPVLSATTSYYVQNNTTGCPGTNRVRVDVIIDPKPAAPAVNVVGDLCQTGTDAISYTLQITNADVNASYALYKAGNKLTGTIPSWNEQSAGPIQYQVSQTLTGVGYTCESNRTTLTVTPKPKPVAPSFANVISCGTTNLKLTASGQGGAVFNWYNAESGGLLLGSGSQYGPSGGFTTTTTAFVEQTVNGCTSGRSRVTATINPITPVPLGESVIKLCKGASAYNLASDLTVGTGGTFSWTNVPDGQSGGVSLTGNTFNQSSLPVGNYTVTYTVPSAATLVFPQCLTNNTKVIQVTATGGTTALPNRISCLNETPYNLNSLVTVSGGTWSGPGVSSGSTISLFNPSQAGTGTHNIAYNYSIGGCPYSNTMQVIVNAIPPTPTVSGNSQKCTGQALTLQASIPVVQTVNYEWFKEGQALPFVTTVSPNRTITYTVTKNEKLFVRSKNLVGCLSNATEIPVNTPFNGTGTIQIPKPAYEIGEVVPFSTDVTNGTAYLWEFGNGAGNSREGANTAFVFYEPGYHDVKLTVSSSLGCNLVLQKIGFVEISGTYQDIITDVEQEIENSITVYPNPFSNEVTIEGVKNDGKVLIVDASGKTVLQENISSTKTTLNLESIPQGQYIMAIEGVGDVRRIFRIIKK